MTEIPRILMGAEAAVPEAGGKGAALAKLAATFPVPAFFVITADAFTETGLKPGVVIRAPAPLCCDQGATTSTSAPAAHNALRSS